MGITAYGGISEAKYSEGGVYVLPGVYRFEIIACKHITTRKKVPAFVAEFKILESSVPTLPIGSTCSWMVTLDKEPALGNVKQFVMAVTNAAEAQVTEELILRIVDEANPLRGQKIRCSAIEITTKANRPFTKVKFLADELGATGAQAAHNNEA